METVTRVNFEIIGDRNYPIAAGKIPSLACADFSTLMDGLRVLDPSLTEEDVVRAIFRYGSRTLYSSFIRPRLPLRMAKLPGLVPALTPYDLKPPEPTAASPEAVPEHD